jgi:Zn-dependent M28 family amino/carboxypeptidase
VTGRAEAANVVAELPGRDPGFVLVGAHLDSVYLAPGALDNAAGVAMVLEAARLLRRAGVVPRRAIRFVLFTGEEQGMVGSRAYAAAHARELDGLAAALIVDSGAGRPTGFLAFGRAEVAQAVGELLRPLAPLGAAEVDPVVSLDDATTDVLPFVLAGAPTLELRQEERDYDQHHHRATDTSDKADPLELATGAAALALAARAIADADRSLGGRLAPAATKALVDRLGWPPLLEALGAK